MADENETKISDAVGPMNAESPTESPTGVPALSAAMREAYSDLKARQTDTDPDLAAVVYANLRRLTWFS